MTSPLRLFIAVLLPAPQRATLEAAIANLRQQGVAGVRWVRPEGIHLTLKFLGDVHPSQVEAVASAMRAAAEEASSFQLQLASLGVFPSLTRPRVIWAGVAGQMEQLAALQAQVEERLEPLGYPREGRPFSPHLTLGRLGERATPAGESLRQVLAACAPDCPAPWRVGQACLMQTTMLPGGSRYDVLATADLRSDDQIDAR